MTRGLKAIVPVRSEPDFQPSFRSPIEMIEMRPVFSVLKQKRRNKTKKKPAGLTIASPDRLLPTLDKIECISMSMKVINPCLLDVTFCSCPAYKY